MAINSGHITSWENDALDRIKEAVREEGRTVSAVLIDGALKLEGGEHRTMPIEDVTRLAPSVSYLRVKASAFDKYGEETTIDYGDALEPFEKAAYRGTISIGFDGDGDPVTGVIKTRDLLVKEWVASAKTN